MQHLEIRLSVPAVAPLLQRLEPLAGHLKESLANPVTRASEDPDFLELWAGDLLQSQREDLAALAGLFDEEFHRSGRILIDSSNCDGILRACAALRLRLRETELTFANDAQLESGEPDFEAMSPDQQLAYGCYVVLATLQEIIIDNLDFEDADHASGGAEESEASDEAEESLDDEEPDDEDDPNQPPRRFD